ncbi:response regulator [Clostridium aestuarii]|uniref:Stage 0 sporulation protein A homolog n=1 Tax=Clostridium aestuarii TaxID=338193 RepID=A0ABT4CYU8_9CLOT|nr:response regulator [Clostridium aestuarii]MCY6484159.1 response regulator [Clostridium aestuarii]
MNTEEKYILVIDDSASIRKFIRIILEEANYKIYEACDGEEGINVYKESDNIDLVITDVYMPKKSGLQVVIELGRLNKDIKTIVLSDGGEKNFSNELEVCEALGATYFIKKDFVKDKLIKLVNEIFSE